MCTALETEAGESSALLNSLSAIDATKNCQIGNEVHRNARIGWIPQKYGRVVVVGLCTVSILSIDVGVFIQMAPLTRILESNICHSYYRHYSDLHKFDTEIPEKMCKVTEVQSELAMLKGWSALFDYLPSVFLAVPYGFIADKYGRKLVLMMAISGVVMGNIWVVFVCLFPDIFPTRFIWFSFIFNILGGGAGVAASLILTIVADVVSDSQRSTTFFRITAAVLIAQIIAIPFSSVLMPHSIWLPMFLGVGAMVFGGLILIPLPETLTNNINSTNSSAYMESEDGEDNLPAWRFIRKYIRGVALIVNESRFIFLSPKITILVLTFLVNTLGRSSIELLLQYASQKYSWTIAQSSFLLTLRATVQLGVLILVLPSLSHILTKDFSIETKIKDLYISRGSVALLILGSVGIGLSPTPILMATFLVIYALGSGFSTAIRSLATSLVEPHQVGRLYAAMTTMDMAGGVIAGPSLSLIYSFGLNLDGPWVGLPFLVSGFLFLLVALPLWLTRFRPLCGNI